MAQRSAHLELEAILEFLQGIGLLVLQLPLEGRTFMPGVAICSGQLVIDPNQLLYPGDLLHEAGHMAVMTTAERAGCDGDTGPDGGAEMCAIAWSYAAALHIGIDPRVVFHAGGYRSGSNSILENFGAGRYVGTPLLQWYGLTVDPGSPAARIGEPVIYPRMIKWLRE